MRQLAGQVTLLVVAAAVLGVGRNTVVPGRIQWVGEWAKQDSIAAAVATDPAAKPPSAQPDDPPFLSMAEALAKYNDPDVIFVDAREPEDYEAGHIKGAVLLPFDLLDDYWEEAVAQLPKDKEIVTYCSGAECELSLFLARYMRDQGYEKISIFFGGWVQWQEEGAPIATGQPGAETGGGEAD
jgi:rhodanese-related sulfurtransferase